MLASLTMHNASRIVVIAAIFVVLLGGCGTINQGAAPEVKPPSAAVDEVARWLVGNYSSAAQAARDAKNFKSVTLHITPIWTDRIDGRWMYVEQAMTDSPDKPTRQYIFRLMDNANGVESMVLELPGDPLVFAGAWKDAQRLNQLMPKLVVPRIGCSIYLQKKNEIEWSGATKPQACESTLRGAAYASSQVAISPTHIHWWDQGFDNAGKQIWGATEGPYIFIKESQ